MDNKLTEEQRFFLTKFYIYGLVTGLAYLPGQLFEIPEGLDHESIHQYFQKGFNLGTELESHSFRLN